MSRNIKITIVFLVIASILFVAAFGFWYSKRDKPQKEKIIETEIQETENEVLDDKAFGVKRIEDSKKECEEDGNESCMDDVIAMEAINDLSIDKCREITSGQGRTDCITEVAILKDDESYCSHHEDENSKDACISLILGSSARENSDINNCLKIPRKGQRESCFYDIVSKNGTRGYCEGLGEMRQACLDIILEKEAFSGGDISICNEISDDSKKDSCLSELGGTDADDDGLSYLEEQEYNTDPLNPDTDGDTFLDGEEVRNGYNPNGEGKLGE